MTFFRPMAISLVMFFLSRAAAVADVDAGYDVYSAAQVMIDKAAYSWEWGTAAEALLELYNPELSVFSSDPFPSGQIPKANTGIFALQYAQQFINVNGQIFVQDSAVGDPASLGVSALLIGQSHDVYLQASYREADYILNQAPRWSNGAISQRADVAELWADNMAMSFPFLAYLAVQNASTDLMGQVVEQCSLQRAVLKTTEFDNWQHIVGPPSPDSGLWSTGNGWAAYGMVRVLHTIQKWSGSETMTDQAAQVKGWIKEIIDGAMLSELKDGLLLNYLNDASWFGEISGTALLTAATYRMAVNDPATFPQNYIDWADANRKALGTHQGTDGVFSPAVNPLSWKSTVEFTSGSPEGQAFTVYLYAAYRDCISAGVCAKPPPSVTTISKPGIGPIDILTMLSEPVIFSAGPTPTGKPCGPTPESCDADGCAGTFQGITEDAFCTAGPRTGCSCTPTSATCGQPQSCDKNGCAGKFDGLTAYAQCTGNFAGCNCTATASICGERQSCDKNGCAGAFGGLVEFAQCTGNFIGCNCTATSHTCGAQQSCDHNGCDGAFDSSEPLPQCTGNFVGCNCTVTSDTCGEQQSCDHNGCAGTFDSIEPLPQCSGNFLGCNCTATPNTCGAQQSCDLNGCAGAFDSIEPLPQCSGNFIGCNCTATSNTCGAQQSCDLNGCAGTFASLEPFPQCSGNFLGCNCTATSNTCGEEKSCDDNGCAGIYNADGVASCSGNFQGCKCLPTSNTCGAEQDCDLNGCAGQIDPTTGAAHCTGNFAGCVCLPVGSTCPQDLDCDLDNCAGTIDLATNVGYCTGSFPNCECIPVGSTCAAGIDCDQNGCDGTIDPSTDVASCHGSFPGCPCTAVATTCVDDQDCTADGCNGAPDSSGDYVCTGSYPGCPCTQPVSTGPPPLVTPVFIVGLYQIDSCNPGGQCWKDFSLGALNTDVDMNTTCCDNGATPNSAVNLCGADIGGAVVTCFGDITQQCADPGVAQYNYRTCRTYCPSLGDQETYMDPGFYYQQSLTTVLVCDRALPSS